MTDDIHDVILVGAGVAGSRLLTHLLASPWRTRRILVIERAPERHEDHALAFWTAGASALDPLVEHGWTALRSVALDGREFVGQLRDHRYVSTRRSTIVGAAAALGGPNVARITGDVGSIHDEHGLAVVHVGAATHRGRLVFDSRRPSPGPATVRLIQRFTGWVVETVTPCFDPGAATLFDFRTDQAGATCFVYVLPFSSTRALVEHVAIGPVDAALPEPGDMLRGYLTARLGVPPDGYSVTVRERGESPLSDARHPRRAGRCICNIGLRGGRLKPSSGYALARIERDSLAIVRSLASHGHPFGVPRDGWWYRSLDAIFLRVLAREPARSPAIFAALMRRPDVTLRFLDERAGLVDLLRLLVALPTWVFLRATLGWALSRRAPPHLKTAA